MPDCSIVRREYAREGQERTVWMRIGRSPSLACLFLSPFKMACVAGRSSASAFRQHRQKSPWCALRRDVRS